ncbi:MAG: hypothetical protein AABX34_03990 [Nanoarchaeota archaeon]
MAKYITYGSSNPNKLDPTTRIKYGILDEIVPNEVTRVTQQWGVDMRFMLEKDGQRKPMYETHGIWIVGVEQGREIKVAIANRAVRDLSDLAFEGLVYHSTSEALLRKWILEQYPQLSIDSINAMPASMEEPLADVFHDRYFGARGLVEYRVETANIDYRDGGCDPQIFQEYLSGLEKHIPLLARQIWQGIDFRDQIPGPVTLHYY